MRATPHFWWGLSSCLFYVLRVVLKSQQECLWGDTAMSVGLSGHFLPPWEMSVQVGMGAGKAGGGLGSWWRLWNWGL